MFKKFNSLISHKGPDVPGGQEHVNPFTKSLHVPPFWQGKLAHSLMSLRKMNNFQKQFKQIHTNEISNISLKLTCFTQCSRHSRGANARESIWYIDTCATILTWITRTPNTSKKKYNYFMLCKRKLFNWYTLNLTQDVVNK